MYLYTFPRNRLEHLEHISRMIDDQYAEVDGSLKGERFKVNRGETFFSPYYHGHLSERENDISH